MSSIALVDCDNFFVSCERVFRPKWRGRPVVVLSNNDGCIIARSSEAKKLGIPMGAPHFKWKQLLQKHDVIVCSSNFSLYGDFSHRIMEILAFFNPHLEIYSVDEAFLDLTDLKDPLAHCQMIRTKILQWTGIPVSIGIAPTKTLAKVAAAQAKQDPSGVCALVPDAADSFPIKEVGGVGRRLFSFLAKRGIHTVAQFKNRDDLWLRNNLSVFGLRVAWELRGIACFSVDDAPSAKKSILSSSSFSRPLFDKEELAKAVASHAQYAAKKLRRQKSRTSYLQVFISTSRHKEGGYANCAHTVLPEPTAYSPTLIARAKEGLDTIFRAGYAYKRAGVLYGDLVSDDAFQQDLFVEKEDAHQRTLMELIDNANAHFGYEILSFAAAHLSRKKEFRSPCFTTNWRDILTIQI